MVHPGLNVPLHAPDVKRLLAWARRLLAASPALRARRKALGWTALSVEDAGLAAVTVRGPARPGARPAVLKAAFLPGAALNASSLAELAPQVGVAGYPWVLLPSREDYRVTVLPQPAVAAAELAQSVRWQLAPVLDFPIEEALVEHMAIPTAEWLPDRPQELYAIAARAEPLRRYAEAFKEARLNLAAIDVRETAQRNLSVLAEEPGQGVGMVAFGERHVQITFTWRGELYMDRLIAEPVASVMESPARRGALYGRTMMQVQRSIDAVHHNLPFLQLGRVIVAGATGDFCAELSTAISEPVEPFLPQAMFDLEQAPQLADPATCNRHFHALGGALRELESAR